MRAYIIDKGKEEKVFLSIKLTKCNLESKRSSSQFGPSSSDKPQVLGSGQVFTSGGKSACLGVSHLDQDHQQSGSAAV